MTPAAHAAPLPVSVVIPAYNAEQTVERALRGVARQQPAPPAEMIVVDDRSSDATGDVAADHGAKVIRHDRNRGTAAARNTALASATQPWIAFLDADDEWLPHHLGVAVGGTGRPRAGRQLGPALRTRPATDIIHGPPGPRALVPRDPALLVFPGNMVAMSAAMARRDVVQKVGGFRDHRTDRGSRSLAAGLELRHRPPPPHGGRHLSPVRRTDVGRHPTDAAAAHRCRRAVQRPALVLPIAD